MRNCTTNSCAPLSPEKNSFRCADVITHDDQSVVLRVVGVRPEAIESKWTEEILKERGLKAPIAEVKALPASQAPKN